MRRRPKTLWDLLGWPAADRDKVLVAQYPTLHSLISGRNINEIEALLQDHLHGITRAEPLPGTCGCGCGTSLKGMRRGAKYAAPSHRVRAAKERKRQRQIAEFMQWLRDSGYTKRKHEQAFLARLGLVFKPEQQRVREPEPVPTTASQGVPEPQTTGPKA